MGRASAKALENTIPEPIPYEELDINMGERWIDTKLYADFASDLFGVGADVMYFDVNDTYLIRLQGYSPVAYNTYSVRNYNGEDLFVHALHDTVPEITKEEYRNGSKIRVPDEEAMQEPPPRYRKLETVSTGGLTMSRLEVRTTGKDIQRALQLLRASALRRLGADVPRPLFRAVPVQRTLSLTERRYLDD